MACFLGQYWQWGSWCDSASPFLAQNTLYRNASMFLVAGLVAWYLHTHSSNFTCKFGGRFHCIPTCANASLNSAFAFHIVSARILPFPANALTVSQPVKACSPSNAMHTSGPTDAATFDKSIKRVRVVSATLLKQWSMYVVSECETEDEDICITSAQITTASNPSLDAWSAWISNRLSASSWWLDRTGTSSQQPIVIFQHVSRFVTYRHFPTNLSVYFCFVHTFSRNCSKLALLQDCRKNLFHCFTNCVPDMFCSCSPWSSPRRVRSTFLPDESLGL